jgi:hypothetical protein
MLLFDYKQLAFCIGGINTYACSLSRAAVVSLEDFELRLNQVSVVPMIG